MSQLPAPNMQPLLPYQPHTYFYAVPTLLSELDSVHARESNVSSVERWPPFERAGTNVFITMRTLEVPSLPLPRDCQHRLVLPLR